MTTEIANHISQGGGVCGTCAQPAAATPENEGYSDCCNDRIEYGLEASETVARANCSHTRTKRERVTSWGLGGVKNPDSFDTVCADCGEWIS